MHVELSFFKSVESVFFDNVFEYLFLVIELLLEIPHLHVHFKHRLTYDLGLP
jgi:hypothetical protein